MWRTCPCCVLALQSFTSRKADSIVHPLCVQPGVRTAVLGQIPVLQTQNNIEEPQSTGNAIPLWEGPGNGVWLE